MQPFLDLSPKTKGKGQKINKWDLIKLKNFCIAKETVDKTERQPIEWEKIFANNKTDKELLSKMYIKLIQLNIKKRETIQLKKWSEDLKRYSPKEDMHTNGQQAHEKMLNIPIH